MVWEASKVTHKLYGSRRTKTCDGQGAFENSFYMETAEEGNNLDGSEFVERFRFFLPNKKWQRVTVFR